MFGILIVRIFLKESYVKVDGLEEWEEIDGKWFYLYVIIVDELFCIVY